MSATGDPDDALEFPEPDPSPRQSPRQSPGFASWAERYGGAPPPYEESREQVDARRVCRGQADQDSVERRRKRVARIAKRREAAAQRALARRYDEAGG